MLVHRFAVVRRTRHRDVVVPFLDFCCRRVFLLAAVVFVGSSPLVNGSSPVSCVRSFVPKKHMSAHMLEKNPFALGWVE